MISCVAHLRHSPDQFGTSLTRPPSSTSALSGNKSIHPTTPISSAQSLHRTLNRAPIYFRSRAASSALRRKPFAHGSDSKCLRHDAGRADSNMALHREGVTRAAPSLPAFVPSTMHVSAPLDTAGLWNGARYTPRRRRATSTHTGYRLPATPTGPRTHITN